MSVSRHRGVSVGVRHYGGKYAQKISICDIGIYDDTDECCLYERESSIIFVGENCR